MNLPNKKPVTVDDNRPLQWRDVDARLAAHARVNRAVRQSAAAYAERVTSRSTGSSGWCAGDDGFQPASVNTLPMTAHNTGF